MLRQRRAPYTTLGGSKVLKLENSSVLFWQFFPWIPRRMSEALKASVLLEADSGRDVGGCVDLIREPLVFTGIFVPVQFVQYVHGVWQNPWSDSVQLVFTGIFALIACNKVLPMAARDRVHGQTVCV
jgi:hypothetical protein